MFGHLTNRRFAFAVLLVSLVSFVLIWDSANDEPFVVYRPWDFIKNVVLGSFMLLIVAYLLMAFVVCLSRRKLSPWSSLLALWLVILGFYLWVCPAGYLEDMARYHWQTTFSFPQ